MEGNFMEMKMKGKQVTWKQTLTQMLKKLQVLHQPVFVALQLFFSSIKWFWVFSHVATHAKCKDERDLERETWKIAYKMHKIQCELEKKYMFLNFW